MPQKLLPAGVWLFFSAMGISTSKAKISKGSISVKVNLPAKFNKGIFIANGAGGPMHSPFIVYFFKELAKVGYATCSFNFFYQEQKKKSPDRMPILQEAFLAALEVFKKKSGLDEKNIVLSGKSMGGRVASHLVSEVASKKLVLLGYPLHPPGNKEKLRDEHLYPLRESCLFISGTRDSLCDLSLLKKVTGKMKSVKLHIIEAGDHSFKVTKSSGQDQDEVFAQCISQIKKFVK